MKLITGPLIKKITADFNQGIQYSKKCKILIFFSVLLTFFVVGLVHNLHLFLTIIYEREDNAANSILINLAKSLQLFVGHYSRLGFNHPGPAFLYVMAFFEKILYDCLHIVPSAFNAQVIGIMFLNSIFLAICCYIFFDFTKSIVKTLSVIALMLFFYFLNPVLLYSTWMAYAFFAPFFAFILSSSTVSAKRSSFIWVMVLSGLFLIHGHVAFILFVCPILLISFILCLSKYEFDINKFVQDNRFNIIASLIFVLVFLYPIILNTIINYPGEFQKYFSFDSNQIRLIPNVYSILEFFLPFWSIVVTSLQYPSKLPIQTTDAFAGFVSLFLIICAIVLIYRYTSKKELKDILRSTGIIILIVSTLFLIYIVRGIDELNATYHYTGIFFYAVPLLLLCLIIIGVLSIVSNTKIIIIILIISLLTIFITVSLGNFTNPERGSLYTQEIITKLQSDPRWNNDTIVLDFPHDYWPEVTGIVVSSERLGKPVYVNPGWEFIFTKNHIIQNNQDPSKKIWHLILMDKKDVNQNVIYTNPEYSLSNSPNSAMS